MERKRNEKKGSDTENNETYVIACLGLEDIDSGTYRLTRNILLAIKPLTEPIPLLIGHGTEHNTEHDREVGKIISVAYLRSCKGLFAIGKLNAQFVRYIKTNILPKVSIGKNLSYLDVLQRMYMGCSLSSKWIEEHNLMTNKGRKIAGGTDFLRHVALTRQPRREFAFVHYTDHVGVLGGKTTDFLRAFGIDDIELPRFLLHCTDHNEYDSSLKKVNTEELFPVILSDLLKPMNNVSKLRRKMNEKGLSANFLLASTEESVLDQRDEPKSCIKQDDQVHDVQCITKEDFQEEKIVDELKPAALDDCSYKTVLDDPSNNYDKSDPNECCKLLLMSMDHKKKESNSFVQMDGKKESSRSMSGYNGDVNTPFMSGFEAAFLAMKMMKDKEKEESNHKSSENRKRDEQYQVLLPIHEEPPQTHRHFPNEFYHPESNSIFVRKRPSSMVDYKSYGNSVKKKPRMDFDEHGLTDFDRSENDTDREEMRHFFPKQRADRHELLESQSQIINLASELKNYLKSMKTQSSNCKQDEIVENTMKNNHASIVDDIVSQLTPYLKKDKESIETLSLQNNAEKDDPKRELQASCGTLQPKKLNQLAEKERLLGMYEGILT